MHLPNEVELSISDTYTEDNTGYDVVISVMYKRIIPDNLLDPDVGYFNLHPGILPEYAGSCTLSWSLFNGEDEAGITLHVLSAGIDTGNIIEIERFSIEESDTAQTLFSKAEEAIFTLFKRRFVDLIQGQWMAVPQDLEKRGLYLRKALEGGMNLTRQVRAFTFDGKPQGFFVTRDGRKFELDYEKGAKLLE
jgi:methionyl-tRNA formyltransferase